MSKVNPVQTSASASSIDQLQIKCKPAKKRRKSDRLRLPTPPPDPTCFQNHLLSGTDIKNSEEVPKTAKDKEAEFLEYLETLQKSPLIMGSRSGVSFAPAEATEAAITHLDKLYKLMGQMLTLREQNIVLHRRIMDLERFRSMQCMDKQMELIAKLDNVADDLDTNDTANAENLLYNILNESKKESKKVQMKFQKSITRKSVKMKSFEADCGAGIRRISMPLNPLSYGDTNTNKQAKVSKWTKVKAAFRWEKASPTVSDAKSQDSGLGLGLGVGSGVGYGGGLGGGLVQPMNYEVARYLRVPSTSEDTGASPADSGAAEVSTPATLSSASSAEDIHHRHHARRRTHEDTSDDDQLFMYEYIPCGKDEASTSKGCIKHHKTPWAKVKDIIQTQTRNSFKIRHRLSAKSDDFKLDDSIIVDSDNEEVFDVEEPETEPKSPILIIQSPEEISLENAALSLEHNIPVDVIARYRIISDENGSLESKWEKVKKAFLHSPTTSKNDSSSPTTPEPYSTHARNNLEKHDIQAEIQQNYLQLQKKLSLEFQEKLQEWERTKIRASSTSALSTSPHNSSQDDRDSKDQAFKKKMEEWQKIKGQPKHNMQLKSEENLPPEFRKKLEEWKRIKKLSIKEDKKDRKPPELPKWKSFGGPSPKTDLENQQLSEDFLKKYETWKQIKAGTITPEESERITTVKGSKTPSPKLIRKDGSQKKSKDQAEKELQWFDKGIEKEKQRLERDKQKFLDREQRLSKLRRSVIGQNKKEILVHLPSGFYRFEGISRKFTQKLYEWEKARGIRPEKSTFTLLKSSVIPQIETKNKFPPRQLMRSKSADSVMNEPVPMLSQRPSSLSLNELGNLEEEILLPDIICSGDNKENEEENEEPEAVIVEVEDVVEETASVMPTFAEKHFAVYQKQETDKLCAGATNLGPTVRRSESARAQANYNLIEEIMDVLKKLANNESEISDVERAKSIISLQELCDDQGLQRLKYKQEEQKNLSEAMIEKLVQLQEANSNVAVNIAREEPKYKMANLIDVLDSIQDLTNELFALAESIDHFIYKRNKNQLEIGGIVTSRDTYPQIGENLGSMKEKMLELRRNLSYICAASDIAVASFKRQERPLLRSLSRESKKIPLKKSRSKEDKSEDKNDSPTLSRQIEQGAVKKRMRYRQKGLQTKSFDESDDDDELILQEQRKAKPRRMRSQNSTESNKSLPKNDEEEKIEKVVEQTQEKHQKVQENIQIHQEKPQTAEESFEISLESSEIVVDPTIIEKVLIPTKPAFMNSFEELVSVTACSRQEQEETPVTVFVKTTRKLFTPIVNSGNVGGSSGGTKSTDDDRTSRASASISSLTSTSSSTAFSQQPGNIDTSETTNVSHLPPIPASPTPQRKLPKEKKEISPNIRLMMVRYNQKLNEDSGVRSGGSSGSASPVAWRSPVLERRVKAQTEKYQQEIQSFQKMSPLLGGRREVQKSASMGVVISGNKQVTVHKLFDQNGQSQINPKGILKSSSANVINPNSFALNMVTMTKPSSPIPEAEDVKSQKIHDSRSLKLQKAKEEFLKGLTTSSSPSNKNSKIPNTADVSDFAKTERKSSHPPKDPPENVTDVKYKKNRLSQVSVTSDLSSSSISYGLLIKSASVGMINVDPLTYKQFDDLDRHVDGSTSLPRSSSSKKNLLSNLTSKFRKVKMRRNKDRDKDKEKEKMNTVSTLCRQSLVVDIHNSSQETLSEGQSRLSIPSDSKGSSTDTSPSTSRTSSWIKRSRIFSVKKQD